MDGVFSSLAIGSSHIHASVQAIKKESFPRSTGAGQTGTIMQKNRNLERNLVNKKAMFLAIRLPFVLFSSALFGCTAGNMQKL